MYKLLVKALRTTKRDTNHSLSHREQGRLLGGDRTRLSCSDSQQSVPWD